MTKLKKVDDIDTFARIACITFQEQAEIIRKSLIGRKVLIKKDFLNGYRDEDGASNWRGKKAKIKKVVVDAELKDFSKHSPIWVLLEKARVFIRLSDLELL